MQRTTAQCTDRSERIFTLTSYEDGPNADWQAMHYLKKTRQVSKGDTVKIKMFRNGGYAASLK